MVFWIKPEKDGRTVRLEDNWSHSIYIASDNKYDLASVAKDERISSFIKSHKFVQKYEKVTDNVKSEVLKLTLIDSSQAQKLAKSIMLGSRFGQFRLIMSISCQHNHIFTNMISSFHLLFVKLLLLQTTTTG